MDAAKLAKYIRDAGLSFKQNSKSFIFTCPLCGGKEKLYIRKRDGRFACWKCRETEGFQGAPEYAFAEILGTPIAVIRKALYGHNGERTTTFINLPFKDFLDEDDDLIEVAQEEVIPQAVFPYHCITLDYKGAKRGVTYLESRGIPLEVAQRYQIRYSPEKEAIVFPIMVNQVLVGWQYRTIGKTQELLEDNTVVSKMKAWSSKDIPRDRVFMFQDNLIASPHAVLCEGPIDAIKVDLVGGGVCAMGKVVTQAQVNRILMSGVRKVYVALDPDAFKELNPLLSKFTDAVEVYRVEIPNVGKKPDLGALSFEEARRCVLEAKPLEKNRLYIWMKRLPHTGNS